MATGGCSSSGDALSDSIEMTHLYSLESPKSPPVKVELLMEGKKVDMELDTGATVTVMGARRCRELGLAMTELKKTNIRLKTYTGEVVEPEGTLDVVVDYEGQVKTLSLVVVKGEVPTLLGRNWLDQIKLNWSGLFPLCVEGVVKPKLRKILEKYVGVFSNELGCLQNFEVSIPVDENVAPKFCKARPVPYALKEGVEAELDRLERQGIFRKVEYARWAAPVVPVVKDSAGTVRLCGDDKQCSG